MKTKIREQTLWLFALLGAILCMGVGYASINSITGEITGDLVAKVQKDVFITNVEYVSDVDANLGASKVERYVGTLMQSTVELSKTNSNSEITYRVTVYNNSANRYPFLSVNYDEEFYDNPNIIFEISGFVVGDIIEANETKEILITFKYKDGVIPQDKNAMLNSYIDFKIAEPKRLMAVEYGDATTKYLRGTVTKDKIESIDFVISKEPPTNIIESFDASAAGDKSIMGYYTNSGTEGLYKLTFVSDEMIAANKNTQNLFQNLTNLKEINLNNFSTFGVTRMTNMFRNCNKLTSLDVSKFDTSQVKSMQRMFNGCRELTELDVSNFITDNVTDMSHMFETSDKLTALDLSNFKTGDVTTMEYMFNGCSGLTELDVSKFDTGKVTTLFNMFLGCDKLTTLDVSNFDTGQVTNMASMFYGCKELTKVDVSGFNTSQCKNTGRMFTWCGKLTEIDVSGFDTSQVTNMESMFYGCSGLTELDVSKFDTSRVKSMQRMFNACSKLKILDVTNFNTNSVTDMSHMFETCTGLTELDISNFNTNNVTDMGYMFSACNNLKTIYVREFNTVTQTGWTTSLVTTSGVMFTGCTSLRGGNGTTISGNPTDATYARIDTSETPGYFTDIKYKGYVSIDKIFDATGTDENKLHIGDFVNYDAGTWTAEEIQALKDAGNNVSGSTALPTEALQFGGFAPGSSRNGNAIANKDPWHEGLNFDYVKDASTWETITGWRVFDIEDGRVILISAGCPEDFFVPSSQAYDKKGGWISEYILTGNVNSNWTDGATESANYKTRSWNDYVKEEQGAESAELITKKRLDAWYSKYVVAGADSWDKGAFQKIYDKEQSYIKYQNMIDNYSFYWLASNSYSDRMHRMYPSERLVSLHGYNSASGVRVLVTLSSDIKFTATKTGTKTVTGGNMDTYGGDQTYNCWDIK